MGKAKKLMLVSLLVTALLSWGGLAAAAGFSDVQGHWGQEQINQWLQKGLVAGYNDGTFRPNGEVTRAEFVVMVNRCFGIASVNNTDGAGFNDLKAGSWYYQDVLAARDHGYIGGYTDGTFRPDQTITRQEAASVLVRLLGLGATESGLSVYGDYNQMPAWSRGSIGAVVEYGLMRGLTDHSFDPMKNITRAEAVVALDRAFNFSGSFREDVNVPRVPGNSGDNTGSAASSGSNPVDSSGVSGNSGSGSGGGGGGGGGGSGGNSGSDTKPADPKPQSPVVKSVTFDVNNQPVSLASQNNVFTVDLTRYNDTDRFNKITVYASDDADKATVSLMGITRAFNFRQGVLSITVGDLMGSDTDSLSLSGLKTILRLLSADEILITVTGQKGETTQVTVQLII